MACCAPSSFKLQASTQLDQLPHLHPWSYSTRQSKSLICRQISGANYTSETAPCHRALRPQRTSHGHGRARRALAIVRAHNPRGPLFLHGRGRLVHLIRHALTHALVHPRDLRHLDAMGAEASHQTTDRGHSRVHVRQTEEAGAILAVLRPGMAHQRREVQR